MESLNNLLSTIDRKKALYAVLVVVAGCIALFVLLASTNKGNVDSLPEEGTLQDYSLRARIVNGKNILEQLGGIRQLNSVSEDLRYFAVTAYSAYKTESPPAIGFLVDGNSIKTDNKISFNGSFGKSNNTVKVEVVLMGNDRISTSITDTKTKLNIDSKLPSNRKINKYIAELPKSEPTYTAEYVRSSDNISIFLKERDPNLLDKALSDLQTFIDDGSYDKKRIDILYPQESIGL